MLVTEPIMVTALTEVIPTETLLGYGTHGARGQIVRWYGAREQHSK
jgi:hypothetical protein